MPEDDRSAKREEPLRSRTFFEQSGVAGFLHRAFTRSTGFDTEDMQRPLIGEERAQCTQTIIVGQQVNSPTLRIPTGHTRVARAR